MITSVRGTQDFLDLTLYNYIIKQTTHFAQRYHFHEIATPIIEHLDLFKRSLGQETDVINKEMFIIQTAEGKEQLCLRPEGTAPIVRTFVENNITQVPWKVFAHGPMFRYERPQKGRYRQFHQITFEIIGSSAIAQDAQLITMFDRLFTEEFTMDNYALHINYLGCRADREKFKEQLHTFLISVQDRICSNCLIRKEKNILRVFDCKNPQCIEAYQQAPHITDALCTICMAEWQQLQTLLELLSVAYTVMPTLVRGLDYYGKTVFEFVSDALGAQSAFCGGGRYDHLVQDLGNKEDQPSIGAAIGIERLLLILEPIKQRLPLPQLPALHIIIPMGVEQQSLALLVADEMRAAGLCVELLLEGSTKSMMRKADKMNARYCIFIGESEQATRSVTVKNMMTSIQEQIPQTDLIEHIKQ